MDISTNPTWHEAERRLEAFWRREFLDRPCLLVRAPKARHSSQSSSLLADVRETGDPEARGAAEEAERVFRSQRARYFGTSFLGEALPVLYYGWEGIAEMLGARVEDTSGILWVRPFAQKLGDVDLSRLDLEGPVVARMLAVVERMAALGAGECFVGHPMHLGNPGDTLAKLRGYEGLCLDLHDDLAGVLELEGGLARVWNALYDRVFDAVNAHLQGSCGWLPCWHPRRSALIEFDFCGMICPSHFERFIPVLLQRARHVERSIYHLDGAVALPHLEAILGIEEIGAIQAQPGDAVSDPLEWLPVYQRIQGADRSLYVGFECSPTEALRLLDELDPAGLAIPVRADSEEEGVRFLDAVERKYR
jgi:hypothetical protein